MQTAGVERRSGTPYRAAGAFGALALVLRLVWVLAVDRQGFAFNDSIMYQSTAESLVAGEGYVPLTGGPTARWPPGYSTFLAGVYRVTGVEPLAGEIANAVLGAITVVLVVLLADRVGGASAGIVAGLVAALLPGPILWTDVLVAETLYTALFVTITLIVIAARPTWRWCVLIGATIGVGAMVRGEAFTWFLLPIAVWWPAVDRRTLARAASVVLAAVAVVVAPWTIRNAMVMDAFVPVATNASQTLWTGHNPDATGGQMYPPDELLVDIDGDVAASELATSRQLRNEAIGYALGHPIHEIRLVPLRLVHLARGDRYALDWVNAPAEGAAPPLSAVQVERIGVLADLGWFGLLTLTVVGGFALGRGWWRQPIGRVAATSFTTALVLYGIVYYGNYRYRLPYEPLMVIVCSVFAARLAEWRAGASTTPVESPPPMTAE